MPAAEAARFAARRLDDPALLVYVAQSLHQPVDPTRVQPWTLGRLSLAALYFHPDLMVARARLAAARAAVRTASEIPNPTLTVLGGTQPQLIGYSLTLLFETFAKRGLRIARARNLVAAAQWNIIDTAWQIRSRVRSALLQYWASRMRLALAQRSVAIQRRLVGLQTQRLAQGAASATDLALERLTLARLEFAASDRARQRDDSDVALATAIGVPVEALASVSPDPSAFVDPPAVVPDDVASLRARALTGRADVRGLLAEYEASQTALRTEIARQYPDLSLSPAYNYDFRNGFEINPSVVLPVFNQNQGPVAEAQAQRQEAAARFVALQAHVAGEIEQASARYRDATATLKQADRLTAQENARLTQSEQAFRAGAIDRPTLVLARAEAATVQAARFDAVVRRLADAGALEDGLQQTVFDRSVPFDVALRAPPP